MEARKRVIYKGSDGNFYLVRIEDIRNDLDSFLKDDIQNEYSSLEKVYIKIADEGVRIDEKADLNSDKIRRFLGKKSGGIGRELAMVAAKSFGKLLHVDEDYYITDVLFSLDFSTDVYNYIKPMNDLKGVLSNLRSLLESTVDSKHFNFIPKTKIDGFDFYQEWIDELDNGIYTISLGNNELRDKLRTILKEIEIFIRKYEIPGISKRWMELNPTMRYFDLGFTLMENDRESYELIKASPHFNFHFYPTESELNDRNNYFKNIENNNKLNNLQYSEERVFMVELLNTFEIVINNDLKEYF